MNIFATFVPLGCPSLNTVMLISSSMSCGPCKLSIKLKRASFWNLSILKDEKILMNIFFKTHKKLKGRGSNLKNFSSPRRTLPGACA